MRVTMSAWAVQCMVYDRTGSDVVDTTMDYTGYNVKFFGKTFYCLIPSSRR